MCIRDRNTVDPIAGSYAVESLTDTIEQGVTAVLAELDSHGGTLAAIERGTIQREIQDSAFQYQQAIDSGTHSVVGVNRFTDDSPVSIDVLRINSTVESEQSQRVAQLRASRDQTRCQHALDTVRQAARGGENLVPLIVDAVEARATVGEVADTLRSEFGEYREEAW